MKIYILIIFIFSIRTALPQSKKTDTTYTFVPDSIKIKESVYLSDKSEKFRYDSLYIWSDKRNLSEIMDERAGYFVYDFGLGARNDINYNSKFSRETGIYRDGIQINDFFYQGFDIQNLSVNEIESIEEISNSSSFFYGINSFAKSINIVTKDVFNTKAFSQLRYSQDREGSLFADFYFSQPVSRKFNIQLGVTKHSLDGWFKNSAFNVWRGRSRINYFPSDKFNLKLNFYLNNWDRQLNDGLAYKADKDSLSDPDLAEVVHDGTNENIENYYFDLTSSARLFNNKRSVTKFKFYGINSLRYLDNPDTVFTLKNFPSGYYHSIQYGAEFMQNIVFKHNKNTGSELSFGGNLYFISFDGNLFKKYHDNYYSARIKYDFKYKNLFASLFARDDYIKDKNFINYGAETDVKIYHDKNWDISANAGLNQTGYLMINESYFKIVSPDVQSLIEIPKQYYEAGGKIRFKGVNLSGYVFGFSYDSVYDSQYGVNINLNVDSKYFLGNVIGSYSQDPLFPEFYVKGDLAFKDVLFRGKLKLKTGFNFKYYKINYITKQYQTWYSWSNSYQPFPLTDQFIADFYLGAKIGKANINITVANILNSLVYNAYIFPLDDRGGFMNAISRFTIVWDFIN